jgi:molybdopterin-binding protein
MKISARNQFKGKIVEIKEGMVSAKIVIDIGGGHKMTSVITMDALKDLDLKIGAEVTAAVKSSSVLVMA